MITNCIIVGLDGSPASRAAHRWAAEYAYAVGKNLCAVHVLDWPIGLNASAAKSGTRLRVPKQDIAEPYWRGMRRVFDDAGSTNGSTLRFAQGDVGEVLVRLSTDADLLVVGTRVPIRGGAVPSRIGQPLLHQPRQLSRSRGSRATIQPSTGPARRGHPSLRPGRRCRELDAPAAFYDHWRHSTGNTRHPIGREPCQC